MYVWVSGVCMCVCGGGWVVCVCGWVGGVCVWVQDSMCVCMCLECQNWINHFKANAML